jgi:hypothetical protein
MSDTDEKPYNYPLPSPDWLAEQSRRVRAEATRPDDFAAELMAIAGRTMARFAPLPCRGEVARIPQCVEEYAAKCDRRGEPGCPRNIAAWEQSQQVAAVGDRLLAAGVPKKAVRALGEDFFETPAIQVARIWAAGKQQTLLLVGSFGVGKSVAAAWAMKLLGGMWVAAADLPGLRIEDKAQYNRVRSARFLVVDDLGTDANDKSGWGVNEVQNILTLRHDEDLRTLVTSNLMPSAIQQAYGGRVWDRLQAGEIVTLGDKSLRGAS